MQKILSTSCRTALKTVTHQRPKSSVCIRRPSAKLRYFISLKCTAQVYLNGTGVYAQLSANARQCSPRIGSVAVQFVYEHQPGNPITVNKPLQTHAKELNIKPLTVACESIAWAVHKFPSYSLDIWRSRELLNLRFSVENFVIAVVARPTA